MQLRPPSIIGRVYLVVGVGTFGLWLFSSQADARTWHVPADAPRIQAAIDSAQSGDDVLLSPGTYTWTNQSSAFPTMLNLKAGLWLHSESGAAATILDGELRGRLILGQDVGSVVIEGLTIQNGAAPPLIQPGPGFRIENHENRFGGGIYTNGVSNPTIRNCIFQNDRNLAQQGAAGGAIACGDATIQDCQFLNNIAQGDGTVGGAVWCHSVAFSNCVFTGNTAGGDSQGAGGAIAATGSTTAMNCSFSNNAAGAFRDARGGAIAGGTLSLQSCLFTNNSVSSLSRTCQGGALQFGGGSIADCIFVGNKALGSYGASASGGAVYAAGANTTHCVFIGNVAMKQQPDGPGNGGALAYVQSAGVVLEKCTLVGNSGGPGGLGGVWANGTTIRSVIMVNTIGNTCFGSPAPTWSCSDLYGNETGDQICGTDGGGNFSADPSFCDPTFANANVTIQDGSPCAPGNHPSQCDLIGAGAVACGSVAIQKRNWSDIKSLYR